MPVDRSQDPLPLSIPEFQVLLALIDRDLHGYALLQEIETRTGGEVSLTASTLYAALKRMLRGGWIAELEHSATDGDGARRRTYRITARGRELGRREAERLERAAQMARSKRLLPALASRGRPEAGR
ncbi:MAG TPA: helix-turn-helix transcriptional regulator [Thermoanaerobaculia bacterium]|nr:helix-turn-helix transcriptional regulator [Thermoanaerobaculia bacterium]